MISHGYTSGLFAQRVTSAAVVPGYDDDLAWILERFVERVAASAGLMLSITNTGQTAGPWIRSGVYGADCDQLEAAMRAVSIVPGHRRRGGDPPQLQWCTFDDGGRALILLLPGDHGQCLAVSALYEPGSPIADDHAEFAAGQLAPVLERYCRMYRRLQADDRQLRALTAALDLSSLAVLVLNDKAELLFSNRAAGDMLDRGDGLRRQSGTITATELSGAVRLQVAIHHAIANRAREGGRRHAPVVMLPRRGSARALACTVLPIERDPAASHDAAVVCYILDPECDVGRVVLPVCRLHGLSPVETRLAMSLVAGATLAEAAAHLRVKEQTARAYLKQIFAKVGTNRQVDLVRLLLTSVAHVYGDVETAAL